MSAPDRTALVVVDVQNAFCHPEGSFARMGYDIAGCAGAVAGCAELVEHARRAGWVVAFVRYAYRADYSDGGNFIRDLHPQVAEAGALIVDTWDTELVAELVPRPEDLSIVKNRYSAFFGTPLDSALRALGVGSLVVCGVTTNVCVESTARSGAELGYRITVVSDATGELERHRHDNALETIGFAVGSVRTLREVTSPRPARPGSG